MFETDVKTGDLSALARGLPVVSAVVMRASISDKRAKLFHFWYSQLRLDLSERNQAFLNLRVATFT